MYTRRDDAQARIQDLDMALGYPRVHGTEAQITPGIHVPAGVARTECKYKNLGDHRFESK